ncbi:Lon protease family protein [Limnohabitans sp. DM1]|uniref:Lon protease family protein n=1 Tax=Limnohabitans sp. DM1 TaxID=1597955 RepID=UPI001E6173EE|nr:ATP-binding protein [Limnohabitans sp. DM1]
MPSFRFLRVMMVRPLSASELRRTIDPIALGFADTSELMHLPLPWIGQERAKQAAQFGMQMNQPDYNLFVLGEVGSGRTTLLAQMMQSEAAQHPVPSDLCFLHNFDEPEHPRALRLPAGQGRVLRQMMVQLAKRLQSDIPKRTAQDDFKTQSQRITRASKAQEDQSYLELSAYAEAHRFALMRDEGHMVFTLKDAQGEPVTAGKALALSRDERAQIDADEDALRSEITRHLDKVRDMERVMNDSLMALRRQTVQPLLEQELQSITAAMTPSSVDSVKLSAFLDQVRHCVLENLMLFEAGDDEDTRLDELAAVLALFSVNVAVDNHALQGAPVIREDNPVFRVLFGSIEYESDDGDLMTDFSRIRAGSLLKAHGGFLMLHLRDLLADPPVWEKLRRFMRSGRLQIEEPGMMYAPVAAVSLEPEMVDVAVKIILIASVEEYYAVQEGDPEFARRFRCKVDFAESFLATPESAHATAVFVAHTCRRLELLHFSAEAVAVLIEQTHREADDQARQSAIFALSEALVLESSALARARASTSVQACDVWAAMQARTHRLNYPEQRLQETIADGERLLQVTGEQVAQINGLTVVDLGDYRFGFPVRVTARTCAGEEGLLNLEREVELSGPIHDKGVLILHSYLSALFAHIAPLAMNASVVFEQEYIGVEGDSASCAEFYALLSSLSALPLRQGIAVTGAINQHGQVLPVGGINEKIEGYFRSCECLGLDGQQGILMPRRNVRHLMLDRRVVSAVAEGRFHIYTADRVAEGMSLLTGWPFGDGRVGGYGADTVLGRAQKTLLRYRRACEGLAARRPHAAHVAVAHQRRSGL